jgi:hypothetical protein
MAVWLIITVGSALIGATLTLHAVARCKQTSGNMLEHYRELLAEARRAKEEEEQQDEEDEGIAEPPSSRTRRTRGSPSLRRAPASKSARGIQIQLRGRFALPAGGGNLLHIIVSSANELGIAARPLATIRPKSKR